MSLYTFDEDICQKGGFSQICGVDEAGRGPLAGPVYAAAVVLPQGLVLPELNDSKKLSEKKREALFPIIQQQALAYCIASASAEEIDEINILQASLLAMRRAVEGLSVCPDAALVDGNKQPGLAVPTFTVIGGDAASACIAAASVLAKVARDHYMLELANQYPEYEFARHKGYPTKLHYQLLDAHGPSPAHRVTFLKKWMAGR